ncbi:ABC transporter permease [Pseudoflavonifractor sp. MSJ-37]|uniref:ABC transporter permease n=1 Tax=Pseudoflavonifractor sp. MSJ-37 TaxID=2841531 RepID=UPI001C11A7B9|nr:ABC transporter permease subunit [Pseudoflavonifractor sp. MSJ-37]MBU5435460.1 ABC transporter permease subunit [Pseudoflavonifractor sp. MSJ-37]
MRYVLNRGNILFAAALAVAALLPSQRKLDAVWPYIVVLFLIEAAFLFAYLRKGKKSTLDIATAAFGFLLLWDVLSRLGMAHPVLAPPPENVFYVFVSQWEDMVAGIFSSLRLLVLGVGLAMIAGVFLGLAVGWIPRLREGILPIANVISPIPPLVYTPYVVAVMPTFKAASVFVIFCAVFWPTFQNMVGQVAGMDRKIIQAAQVMNVSTPTMLFRVILPYCKPGILASLTGTIRAALLCLTGAELLGASSGLGYFVKKYSDYADYTKVIAGIILMGIVVTALVAGIRLLQRKLVKWENI